MEELKTTEDFREVNPGSRFREVMLLEELRVDV